MTRSALARLMAVSAMMTLAACGGGGGSSALNSTPPSPPSPPPPVPPPSGSPFGVNADTLFATAGEGVEFRWIEAAKAYEIRFSGQDWERLGLGDSTSTYETRLPQSGSYAVSLSKTLGYDYTNLATLLENQFGGVTGQFAYGIPTAAGDVPTSGSASYAAQIFGENGYALSGDVQLTFDFGAGTLAGYMEPVLTDAWFSYDLGRYDFTQTVYSSGSTTFSGQFVVPGGGSTVDSGFNGRFTGPGAAELMASWHAPFVDPYSQGWATISGVWIGKRK